MVPPRTTVTLVQGVLGKDWNGTTSLTPYIQMASAIVDRVSVGSGQKGYPLSSVELELCERWLSAHFYCKMDPLYMSKSTADSSASFQRKVGDGFDTTEYGQAACNVDFSGTLTAIGKRQFASLTWLGKPPSQQIDYVNRN